MEYIVTSPDGRKFRVTAPEGATQEQALAYAKSQFAKMGGRETTTKESLKRQNPAEYDPASPEFQEKYGPAAVPAGENLSAGAGKFFTDIGKGLQQYGARVADVVAPRSPTLTDVALERDPSRVAELQREVAEMRQRDVPLMRTGAGKAGYIATGIGVGAPIVAVPGANTVAGAALYGGTLGALQPTESAKETALNTTLGAGLGAGGQYLGQRVSQFVSNRIASGQSARQANQAADAGLAEFRKAGYVTPPATTNPSVPNRLLESVSGKAATKQAAQIRDQSVTNRLVREELGIGKGTPITIRALESIRRDAGKVYQAIKASGDIVPDGQYIDELSNLTRSADEIAESFPDLNVASSAEIRALQDGLLRDKFSANAALELIKQLRKDASSNLKWTVDDPAKRALGLAQREAAGIVEDQILRHLNNTGKRSIAAQFEKARTLIAKTHSVQEALNDSSGNVIASKLAAQLRKGKPLSGRLETVARFGQRFSELAGEPRGSAGVSALDPVVGGAGGLAMIAEPSGIAATALAYPLTRYAARSALLSRPYQNAFTNPNYGPGNMLRALGAGAPLTPAASVLIPGYISQQ